MKFQKTTPVRNIRFLNGVNQKVEKRKEFLTPEAGVFCLRNIG